MGKITSMHFAGWKLGLKTGMYYLRTMAASAPIQFTVDQEALLVADTNVARERVQKKRPTTGFIGQTSTTNSAAPRPMYMKQNSNNNSVPNGVPTPTATPPPIVEKKFNPAAVIATPTFKADAPEGDSPKALATEPASSPPKEEALPEPAVGLKKQDEDVEGESGVRENDIYADAVLQCKFFPFAMLEEKANEM